LLHWGRRGREDRKAEERDREGHGEKVRGGEKKRGEAMGPPLFGSSLRPWQ